jgi:hypothetical protein
MKIGVNVKSAIFKNLGIESIIQLEKDSQHDVNGKFNQDSVYFPDLKDLQSLSEIVIKTGRTTILEFGCGWSSLVFAASLKVNSDNLGSVKEYRRNNPFECHSVDSLDKYLSIAKDRIPQKFTSNIKFYQSKVAMVEWNGKIATEYNNLPLINPDFIYVDAPSIFDVEGDINGWNTKHKDMMPMMCDVLKIEHFLTPKTIIVVDGRAGNTRFLKCNLQRDWEYKYCKDRDQHFFLLEEKPLGGYSKAIIEELYFRNGTWNINDL